MCHIALLIVKIFGKRTRRTNSFTRNEKGCKKPTNFLHKRSISNAKTVTRDCNEGMLETDFTLLIVSFH